MREVRAASPEFAKAVEHVEKRRGKLISHEGLLVLRVDDPVLRAVLSHRFGDDLRPLGGPYVAAPRALAPQLEELVRQEGFSPRRVS